MRLLSVLLAFDDRILSWICSFFLVFGPKTTSCLRSLFILCLINNMPYKKILKLRGRTRVYIDWANVYGWTKSLKEEVDPKKLFKYLKSYEEIEGINFYFGRDKHPKSQEFLKEMREVGYKVTTKPVKYINVRRFYVSLPRASSQVKKIFPPFVSVQPTYIRKCDFDMETCIDIHKDLSRGIGSFVFFTGDGDYAPLYRLLIQKKKQVVVVYTSGHIGREIWRIKRGIFKIRIDNLF